MHFALYFGNFTLLVLKVILASKLSELEEFKKPDSKEKNENEAKIKQMLLPPSFKTDVFGLSDVDLIVKLNFKGSLISG